MDVGNAPAPSAGNLLPDAIEVAPISIAIFDREMRYLAGSRQFRIEHGLDPAEPLAGRSHYDVFPGAPDRWRQLHRRALQGEALQAEEEVARADGQLDWMSWAMRPWRTPDGQVGGLVLTIEHITDRRRRLTDLQAAEQRYRGVFDQVAVGVARIGPDGAFLEVNDRYCKITGFGREELLRRRFQDITHPDDLASDMADAQALLAGEVATYAKDKRYVTPRGDIVWVSLTVSLVRDEMGEPDYFVAVVEDITARKQAQTRLNEAFRIRTVGVLFWGGGDFRLADANDAFLQMTGFSRQEALGKSWQDFTPPEFHPASRNAVAEIAERGETTPYEKQYFRKDGSRWWGLFAGRRIGDEVVEFVLDVTERREAEAALRQLNETLELRVAEEVTARLNAEDALRQSQKMEAIGQLTGGVAHDFNNLLTVIRSSAGLLQREGLPEERRRRYVEAIAETAERAAKLTGQLLAFARRQALKPEVFDVGGRVERICDMLRTVVGPQIELVTRLDCESCFTEADPTQFETALVNMAVNARDAMETGGRLTIRIHPVDRVPPVRGHQSAEGHFVAVAVSDTGVGIPADKLAQIFEPFFTTKAAGKGTGLGLSQVYGFAKQSGGEVDVHSELGKGAVFTLFLPRSSERPGPVDESDWEELPGPARGRILVVEDNEQVGAFSTQMLTELGFETRWAANAEAALKLLQAEPQGFDAVFSDVVMPGMSGIELAREIRRRNARLPVILTSGYSHVLAAEGSQGFELVQKPYSAEEITQVLRRAIASARASH
ncbi:PAS domain S-box protein [Phenylobacterium sp. LjRoot219]|uniref:hybrid sensor histidine kinase/response regulator n=1 Tax=Phenylobacterium sp. LjRoot219 TaxID=3342283 RepID=UPI003ECC7040